MSAAHLPLVREIDVAGPLAGLGALATLPHAFLLHSARPDERSRWSFFGAEPFALFRGTELDRAIALWRQLSARASQRAAADGVPAPPFSGGVVGYWSYDFGRRLERLPALALDDVGLPDFVLGFYDVVGAFDHTTGRAWVLSSGLPLEAAEGVGRARARADRFARRFERAGGSAPARVPAPVARPAPAARSTFDPDSYRRAVDAIRDHIRRGDIFQANLSQRWTVPCDAGDSFALGLLGSLARVSPAPFAAYFHAGDHAVVSASPERFLELRGRRVETRPIKGTRPRAADPAGDAALAAELLASAKDRAENVMIVDVLRNDLGRVCEPGSVAVPALCELEAFPQVFHLTSTVTGTLRAGIDAFDLLCAAFPGGSITGAPKIRAMEILEALEPVRRHVYTGSIGYLDWSGDADWNIAIRTALVTPDAVRFSAGGGITADSDPAAELEETLHKAEGMRAALSERVGPIQLGAEREVAR